MTLEYDEPEPSTIGDYEQAWISGKYILLTQTSDERVQIRFRGYTAEDLGGVLFSAISGLADAGY